jgi:methyl-accepting chemotaxis protein
MAKKGRFMGALRGAVDTAKGSPRSGGALSDAELFRAHEAASSAADSAMSLSQTAGASAAQQRTALEAAADGIQTLLTRGREARASLSRTRDALEQIRLVALNAGLEGARLGDPAGKPLVLVAEEVRTQAGRATDAISDHISTLEQMDREREKLRELVDTAQQRSSDVARDLLQAQALQRDVTSALKDLGSRLEDVTQTDPETAKVVTEAAEHAKALASALQALATKPHPSTVLGALAPALRPLLRLLRELYRSTLDSEEP